MARVGRSDGGNWRQMYLNKNFKKIKKDFYRFVTIIIFKRKALSC